MRRNSCRIGVEVIVFSLHSHLPEKAGPEVPTVTAQSFKPKLACACAANLSAGFVVHSGSTEVQCAFPSFNADGSLASPLTFCNGDFIVLHRAALSNRRYFVARLQHRGHVDEQRHQRGTGRR